MYTVMYNQMILIVKSVMGLAWCYNFREAAVAKAERENDIPKLLEFFKEMKAHNEYFYYDLQVDSENIVKNVFLSHATTCRI